MMAVDFDIVVACDANRGIGKNNGLPWKLSGDMQHFKQLTSATAGGSTQNAVIMGRRTWESIPEKFRPLKGRLNIVLTSDTTFVLPEGVERACSLDKALAIAEKRQSENVFVIGGGNVYRQALVHPQCRRLYVTEIASSFDCDVFLPPLESKFSPKGSGQDACEDGVEYRFRVYEKNCDGLPAQN